MITCPWTGIAVPTGFRARRGAVLDGLRKNLVEHCHACGRAHVWDGRNAYWEGDLAKSPPSAMVRRAF